MRLSSLCLYTSQVADVSMRHKRRRPSSTSIIRLLDIFSHRLVNAARRIRHLKNCVKPHAQAFRQVGRETAALYELPLYLSQERARVRARSGATRPGSQAGSQRCVASAVALPTLLCAGHVSDPRWRKIVPDEPFNVFRARMVQSEHAHQQQL